MTPNFRSAVEIVLMHEGGYVKHPKDPGGETNYGISKRAYPTADIKDLTRDGAIAIYHRDFWTPLKCDSLPFGVALVLFDFGVNAGKGAAVKAIQRAANARPDGVLGPATIAAINAMHKNAVIEALTTERILYYTKLNNWGTFGKGWLRRSIETMSTALLTRDTI